jgi:FAD/FMN-containing dehydrogenase
MLSNIVGDEGVSADRATLEAYSEDMSFVRKVKPAYVVKPRSVEDVQRVMSLAKETDTPIVPVSSGGPHFRGDTVPAIGGAIVVDLSGLKMIVRVDRKNRVALFEPGVTFGELKPAVEQDGLRLNMPLLPRLSKSVVGSLLEREPVTMPKYHWDIADPLACTEVIFGTGDQFRTGAAAGSGTIEEQWAAGGAQKEASGPSSASWYRLIQGSQGTMGIVTWASARCELLPHMEEPFFVGSSQLDKLMEMVHWLIRLRLVNECLVLNNTNTALIMAKKGVSASTEAKNSLPSWTLFLNLAAYEYFPEKRIRGQQKDVLDVARRVGVQAVKALGRVTAAEFLDVVQRPSDEPYWKLRHKGNCQDVFFLTTFDKLPEFVHTVRELADSSGYPASEIGVYIQPIVQGSSCHCEFNLFYDPENGSERTRVKDLSAALTNHLIARGAFFSRPYGEMAGMIMNRDAATVAALKKVKGIVDPRGIMNPGKLCF